MNMWHSPVSTWEALLLNAKGRVPLPANLSEWLTAATAPLREEPLTHEIVLIAQQVPLPHRDPADRFLAATAQLMGLLPVNLVGWLAKSTPPCGKSLSPTRSSFLLSRSHFLNAIRPTDFWRQRIKRICSRPMRRARLLRGSRNPAVLK
jgi:hypothetical protein